MYSHVLKFALCGSRGGRSVGGSGHYLSPSTCPIRFRISPMVTSDFARDISVGDFPFRPALIQPVTCPCFGPAKRPTCDEVNQSRHCPLQDPAQHSFRALRPQQTLPYSDLPPFAPVPLGYKYGQAGRHGAHCGGRSSVRRCDNASGCVWGAWDWRTTN
jgi:hypothetical protein